MIYTSCTFSFDYQRATFYFCFHSSFQMIVDHVNWIYSSSWDRCRASFSDRGWLQPWDRPLLCVASFQYAAVGRIGFRCSFHRQLVCTSLVSIGSNLLHHHHWSFAALIQYLQQKWCPTDLDLPFSQPWFFSSFSETIVTAPTRCQMHGDPSTSAQADWRFWICHASSSGCMELWFAVDYLLQLTLAIRVILGFDQFFRMYHNYSCFHDLGLNRFLDHIYYSTLISNSCSFLYSSMPYLNLINC